MKQVGPEASKKRVIFTTPSLGLIVAEFTTAPIIVLFDLALAKEAKDTFIGLITMFQAALARAHRSDTEKKRTCYLDLKRRERGMQALRWRCG
jgi:hypothetical protein